MFCRKNKNITVLISYFFPPYQANKLFSYFSVQGTTHLEDVMKASTVKHICNRKKKLCVYMKCQDVIEVNNL